MHLRARAMKGRTGREGSWGAGVSAGCGFQRERDGGSGWGKKELTGGPHPSATRVREGGGRRWAGWAWRPRVRGRGEMDFFFNSNSFSKAFTKLNF